MYLARHNPADAEVGVRMFDMNRSLKTTTASCAPISTQAVFAVRAWRIFDISGLRSHQCNRSVDCAAQELLRAFDRDMRLR